MAQVILSIGANLGQREKNLQQAIDMIDSHIGSVNAVSSLYETEPWGFSADSWFLNIALSVDTFMQPFALLHVTQEIERRIGRTEKTVSGQGYQSRVIDIDIIFFDQLVITTAELSVPHPLMHKRNFVLQPVSDIAPNFVHPLLNQRVKDLLDTCEDKTQIRLVSENFVKDFVS